MPSSSTRFFAALFVGLLSSSLTTAQQAYDPEHNVTSIAGTWSSGNGAVMTGPGFANPVNFTFNYPATTGISYSFTEESLSDGSNGYFEEAQYRFQGNGSRPTCIVGVVQWQHGTYTLNSNGSITLNPFAADGRMQVQDMCAAKSNIIQQFNQTTLFAAWNIYQDTTRGYKLQLYRFDGAPLSPMYQISTTPNMLPTELLTNTTVNTVVIGAASSRRDTSFLPMLGVAGAAMFMGLVAVL
ncbi:Reversal of tor2 lethality [Tulasnella sp. UAMH 9824]|nr:Reversal of tor2 lethality [Tulasnella sp. UAMH 9824]